MRELRIKYWREIVNYLFAIMKQMRISLEKEIIEQKIILSEGRDNLTNTFRETAMQGITNLQSARLDRQVEQFEELQKVLVKM
jgi:hypothetical protein